MERARNGDREAFHALFREIGPLITRFVRRRMHDQSEVEDVCQEALIAVYKSRHTYQSARPFEPWLFAIVRKVSSRHLRQSRQELELQVQMDQIADIPAECSSNPAVELREAIAQLSPIQIEALRLTKLLGLSITEASRRAGTTVGSMKVRVHRAYESLKRR
jgi:RNA polymerase sigma-70 factor (ECF subfamily)